MVAAARRLSRMRPAAGGVVMALVWTVAAGVAAVGLMSPPDAATEVGRPVDPAMTDAAPVGRWPSGTKFSDAVQVPGTTSVLMVDDDVYDQIFVWDAARDDVPPQALDLPPGVRVEDAEGIASDGRVVYVTGSHSISKDGVSRRDRLVRLRWTPDGLAADASTDALAALLATAVPSIAAAAGRAPDDGGLNIEGLAWDGRRERLLLGLRSPVAPDGAPLVVPLHWPADAATPVVEPPIRIVGATGGGLRALQAEPHRRGFLLTTEQGNGFGLWRWSGDDEAAATPVMRFPAELDGLPVKVEGVASVHVPGGEPFILAVTDDAPFVWMVRD